MIPKPLATVILEVERPEEMLGRFYPNGRLGGVRLDGTSPAAAGERVDLVVRVKGSPAGYLTTRMRVGWVRHKGNARLRECFGLDFIPEDNGSRERLLSFARGQMADSHLRTEPRFAVQWPAVISHGGVARRESLADVSVGGAFVATTSLPEQGTELEVTLRPPGALLPLRLRARVVWTRRTGAVPGMGLEFIGEAKALEKFRKAVERLTP